MTDGLDQALATAGVVLLQADTSLTVFRGGVPGPANPPYVVVRTTVGRPSDDEDNSGDGRSRVWVARWYCYCVGGGGTGSTVESAEVAAIAVAQRVRTALLDVSPVIAGLSCSRIRWEESSPPDGPNETTGSPVREAIEIFSLRATS